MAVRIAHSGSVERQRAGAGAASAFVVVAGAADFATGVAGSLSLQERSAALVPVTLQRTVSWLALAGLGLGVVIALLVEVQSGNSPYPLLGWLAVVVTAGAFGGRAVGSGESRWRSSGLYLLGLCAAGWALVPLRLSGGMLLWLGTVVLAAYAVFTSYLWSRRASFRRTGGTAGNRGEARDDAEASPSLLIAANLVVAAVVAVLSFGAILTDPDLIRRSSAADAVLASVLAIGLLAWGRRRSLLQGVALSVGVLGAIAWGWAWIEPHSAAVGLDRLVVVFASLVGSTVVYGLGLAKLFPRITEWTRAAQQLVPGLLVLSPLALVVVLGAELVAMSEGRAGGDVRLGGDAGGGDLPDRGGRGADRRGGAGPRPAGADRTRPHGVRLWGARCLLAVLFCTCG